MIKRSSLQPLLVQWFTTIKLSSLASVIGVTEVLHRSQQVIRETYQTELSYTILVLCYVLIVIPVALLADRYERKLS
jgi:ABC-type amino acid transport system permease subunit